MRNFSQSVPNLAVPFLMLPIEGGTFYMGDEHGDLPDDCRPVHQVTISDFYIAKFPVTQAIWRAVVDGKNPSGFQDDNRPVEQVSWYDTQSFIQKLNKLTTSHRLAGPAYRLPTEAEWEYAARSGKYHAEGYRYAGSDRLKDVGWYNENSNNETKPVGLKYPNQLGVHDMSGNVWEWCADWYGGSDYYEQCQQMDSVENPNGPEKGSHRVLRGGFWSRSAQFCRIAYRSNSTPSRRGHYIGFRLALSLQSVG